MSSTTRSTLPKQVKSCGMVIFRHSIASSSFEILFLRHSDRWDFPKGHCDAQETEQQTALRELEEETGIQPSQIRLLPESSFRYETSYHCTYRRLNGAVVHKQLVLFGALLLPQHSKLMIDTPEHRDGGHVWLEWNPGLRLNSREVDGLLKYLDQIPSLQSRDSLPQFFGQLPIDT